jgi:hypothetical protein
MKLAKIQILVFVLLPSLRTLAALLAAKDDNDTGLDDEAANALNFAATRLEKYQTDPVA